MSDNLCFVGPQVECCSPDLPSCICSHNERVLRGYAYRWHAELPAFTAKQREWCLKEIHSVEGYDRKDHENASDADLARTVLDAWVTYCRDKGLL